MKRIKEIFTVFTCILMWCALLGGFTYTYDIATPLGSDAPSVLDDRDRETKAANQERQNIDHYWPLTGTQVSDADAGKHRQVTFQASISTPTQVTDEAHLYMQADDLWYQNDTDSAIQITNGGEIEYQSISDVNNNIYIVAVDAAGTGTVDLIKADANDIAVIPDQSETATNAAPVCSKAIANKKYVDDQVAVADDDAFGSWAAKSNNTVYEAASDGIVTAYVKWNTSYAQLVGYTDSSNPPTTIRTRARTMYNANDYVSIMFPVKKGHFYKVVATYGTPTIYWLPIGS